MRKVNLNFLKSIRNGLCFFALAGMVACGGESEVADNEAGMEEEGAVTDNMGTENTWDADRFNTTFTSTQRYGGWDENDDNFLDENEYSSGVYDTWDVNNDNRLDENEWNTASRDWGMENENWADWDTSGDGNLDNNEFQTGFADNTNYREWDADRDNRLSEREYSDGLFGLWDNNNDNTLDQNEYSAYNTYYGD